MFHPQGPTFRELAQQALSSTEHGYDLLAPKFDYTPFRTPDELIGAALPHLGTPASIDAALDLCCGTGAAMGMLRPLCRQRVTGIDFSRRMLEMARARVPSMPGNAQLDFVLGDVLEMQFREEFDLVVSFGALGHFRPSQLPLLVDQVARSLKPGGRFVFTSCYPPSRLSLRYWMSRGFNAAMHVRNALVRPPFIMFYLTLLVPDAQRLLASRGFSVEVKQRVFPRPFQDECLVVAAYPDRAIVSTSNLRGTPMSST